MPRWLELSRVIERADMEMRLGRQLGDFAGQRRAAGPAKSARGAGGGLELRDLPFRHRVSLAFEPDEDGNGRTAVSGTTLAMASEDPLGRAGRQEAHGATKAPAFELVVHAPRIPALRSAAHPPIGRGTERRCPVFATGL